MLIQTKQSDSLISTDQYNYDAAEPHKDSCLSQACMEHKKIHIAPARCAWNLTNCQRTNQKVTNAIESPEAPSIFMGMVLNG